MSTSLRELKEAGPVPEGQAQQRGMKVVLLLVSIVLSMAAFLALDWIRTAAIARAAAARAGTANCRVSDPERHHSYKPNCTFKDHWGKDWYDFSTNSLGFRDEKVRQVPLADNRPRILLLGDSFTEGQLAWRDSYAAMLAARFPQYDFLNGGVGSYSPSNYFNVARKVLAAGYDVDEVIVFLDTADLADEAAFYRDIGSSGAVGGPAQQRWRSDWYAKLRHFITKHLLLTNYVFEFFERQLVKHGYYHLTMTLLAVNAFDVEGAAWTYRQVDEVDPYPAGYAPLGVRGGLAKEKAKMNLLWQELARRNIPLTLVVYPYPGQVIHDSADSPQVRIWREWCEGKCKRFVSLFPAFLAAKDQCPRLQPGCWYLDNFIFGDFHYSAAGNALVADVMTRLLTEDPPPKRPQDSSQPKPIVPSSAY